MFFSIKNKIFRKVSVEIPCISVDICIGMWKKGSYLYFGITHCKAKKWRVDNIFFITNTNEASVILYIKVLASFYTSHQKGGLITLRSYSLQKTWSHSKKNRSNHSNNPNPSRTLYLLRNRKKWMNQVIEIQINIVIQHYNWYILYDLTFVC